MEQPTIPASVPSLTVVVLTRDEEIHIARALASLDGLASRIVVVDSGSYDKTREIAAATGANVFERPWVNYADQFQWALDHTGINTEWTMRLDADEWLGKDLVASLRQALANSDGGVSAISLDRQHHFMGRWIRHGGRYPLRLLRLWRTGMGRIEQRWMDEHIVVDRGRIRHVPGTFVDQNENDLSFFTTKHDAYATREALDALIAKHALFDLPEDGALESTGQARQTRTIKNGWYNRLPTGLGPLLYFLYRYILQLGFLDGRPGLIYHVLQGFWYRFLVDAKRVELEQTIDGAETAAEKVDRLSKATGHDLAAFAASQTQLPR
ncbi:glycosyltransferase family 2 protein [Parerythrobacter jejuensis]|uniref:Glycosyltransferase n=1 Tax=Parerythrobacter jejuensis TaxID=795812 RepID=A0A845AYM6_9SPHN|nr:glycosyltransferase family 2 protein [Parerythrobacter jejuensis]MXP31101.1 glycosyltransferase [Parerythrobacter jejuensis]MXP33861.1 glycosyltransferase [Parerythrobacter jejuensis]